MNKFRFFLTLIVVTLQSCNLGTHQHWRNENIDQTIKSEISLLNKKIISSFATNNPDLLREVAASELLKESGTDIDKIIELKSKDVKNMSFRILDDYFIENSTINVANTVISGINGDNDYVIFLQG